MQIVYALYLIIFGWVTAHTLAIVGVFVAIAAGLLTLMFGKYLTTWTEIHFPKLHRLPGFRTKTPWRMALAVTVILLALTHISNYLVSIEAKTLQYQTGKTKIFLTIHQNENDQNNNQSENITPQQKPRPNYQSKTPITTNSTLTNQLVLTPDIQIILNWIINTYRQFAD